MGEERFGEGLPRTSGQPGAPPVTGMDLADEIVSTWSRLIATFDALANEEQAQMLARLDHLDRIEGGIPLPALLFRIVSGLASKPSGERVVHQPTNLIPSAPRLAAMAGDALASTSISPGEMAAIARDAKRLAKFLSENASTPAVWLSGTAAVDVVGLFQDAGFDKEHASVLVGPLSSAAANAGQLQVGSRAAQFRLDYKHAAGALAEQLRDLAEDVESYLKESRKPGERLNPRESSTLRRLLEGLLRAAQHIVIVAASAVLIELPLIIAFTPQVQAVLEEYGLGAETASQSHGPSDAAPPLSPDGTSRAGASRPDAIKGPEPRGHLGERSAKSEDSPSRLESAIAKLMAERKSTSDVPDSSDTLDPPPHDEPLSLGVPYDEREEVSRAEAQTSPLQRREAEEKDEKATREEKGPYGGYGSAPRAP